VDIQIVTKEPIKREITHRLNLCEDAIRSLSISPVKPEVESATVKLGCGDETTFPRANIECGSIPQDGPHLGG
jgi:hypothetical protein